MNSLITSDYYDGTRINDYLNLIKGYRNLSKLELDSVTVDMTSENCLENNIDPKALLAFSDRAILKREYKDVAIYDYSVDVKSERKLEISNEYSVLKKDIHSIMSLLSGKVNTGLIQDYYLPPMRMSMDDGQLKLTVDFLLAVDTMLYNDPGKQLYKILVIGSSSPANAVRSGLAYTILDEIEGNFDVRLVDPHERAGARQVQNRGSKVYRRESRLFNYSLKEIENYDLVIDDSWQQDLSRTERDENGVVFEAPNYSIKAFPWDIVPLDLNVYNQKFKTSGHEFRIVSRDPNFFYYRENSVLGTCSGCRELIMRLRLKYDKSLYGMVMQNHRKKCVTGSYNFVFKIDSRASWIEIEPMTVDKSDYYSINDYDFILGTKKLRKFDNFLGLDLIFSSRDLVPIVAYDEAHQVLVIETNNHEERYFVNKLMGEVSKKEMTLVENVMKCTVKRNYEIKQQLTNIEASVEEDLIMRILTPLLVTVDYLLIRRIWAVLPAEIKQEIRMKKESQEFFALEIKKIGIGRCTIADSVNMLKKAFGESLNIYFE